MEYQSNEDVQIDEDIEKFLNRFELKLVMALIFDFLGLLITFLILDFSMSKYILGFHVISSIFEAFSLQDLWYPYRALIGTFGLIGGIFTTYIVTSVIVGIKTRTRPDKHFVAIFKRYLQKVNEAKFKKH